MAVRTGGALRLEAYPQEEKQNQHPARTAPAERELKRRASPAESDLPERRSTTRDSPPAAAKMVVLKRTFGPEQGLDWERLPSESSEQAVRSARLSLAAARMSEPG